MYQAHLKPLEKNPIQASYRVHYTIKVVNVPSSKLVYLVVSSGPVGEAVV